MLPDFHHQRVCWRQNCLPNFGLQATGQPAHRKTTRGGGPRLAVSLKGSALYIAKRGCVIKHPPLLLLRQTWSFWVAWIVQKEAWSPIALSQFSRDQSLKQHHKVKAASPEAVPPEVNYPEEQYPKQGNTRKANRRVTEDVLRQPKSQVSKRWAPLPFAKKWVEFAITRGLITYLPVTRWCKASVTPYCRKAWRNEWKEQKRRGIKYAKDMEIQEDTDTNRHEKPVWGVTTPEQKGLVGYMSFSAAITGPMENVSKCLWVTSRR